MLALTLLVLSCFELDDLVADHCGSFELKVGGGLLHFLFEFLDRRFMIFGHTRAIVGFVVVESEWRLGVSASGVRGDAVFLVVGLLDRASVVGEVEERLDGVRDDIAEEHTFAVDVASGAASGLNQRGFIAEEAFLVGVEDADEGDFGQVEPFAEQVNPDKNVDFTRAETAQDFHTFDSIDVCVDVGNAETNALEILGEVFRRFLGQRGDENTFALSDAILAELDGGVDLPFEWVQGDLRLKQPSGADHLFDDEWR